MVELPFGSWPTPITSELVVRSARLPNGLHLDGDDLWWSEGRPEEAGRVAVTAGKPNAWRAETCHPPEPPTAETKNSTVPSG